MTQYEREQIVKELEGLAEYRTCPDYVKLALSLIRELIEDNEAKNETIKNLIVALAARIVEKVAEEIIRGQTDA